MKVYIVVCDYKLWGEPGFYSSNLGVYDSEEKAMQKVKELQQDWNNKEAKRAAGNVYIENEWEYYAYDIRTIL